MTTPDDIRRAMDTLTWALLIIALACNIAAWPVASSVFAFLAIFLVGFKVVVAIIDLIRAAL